MTLCALLAVAASDATAQQRGTIGWSDGTSWRSGYKIEQSVYPNANAIPRVTVTMRPIRPNRVVVLESRSPSTGKWIREDSRITRRGSAALRVNPICSDGAWCDGTYTFRVRVLPKGKTRGFISKRAQITFVPTSTEEAPPAPEAAPPEAEPLPVLPLPPASSFLGCRFKGKQLWGKIFVADYPWQADAKVHVVGYTWQADLRVQEVGYSWQATSCGRWHFVAYSWQADLKIAYVDYAWQADVKVAPVTFSPGLNR